MEGVGRLFLGIALTDQVRHGLAAHLEEQLEGRPLPGRPVPPENWHLTLRFLGATERLTHERVLRQMAEVDRGPPFQLGFGGLGAFPRPARATVLWLGVERGEPEVRALADRVGGALEAAGVPPEERPFHPHLTLSRIRPHQDVGPLVERVGAFPLRQTVERVVLFRSHLGGGPARYEELEGFPLG